ncbi:MAG: hypothetical protein RBR45_12380 [Pseudomonas sp.]|nr:hypothetical protein [Pseudomonas sp.]
MDQIEDVLRCLAAAPLPRILMISHGIGGGVERHINELVSVLDGYAHVLWLEPAAGRRMLRLTVPVLDRDTVAVEQSSTVKLAYRWPQDAEVFWQLLRWLNLSRVHIHHTQGFASDFWPHLQAQGIEHDLTLHDHSIFTGHASLVNTKGVFDPAWLTQGLEHLPQGDKHLAGSLQSLALTAQRVIVPSKQLLQAVQGVLPDMANNVCLLHRAHPDAECAQAYPQPYLRTLSPPVPLRVLCLGMLSIEKGAGVLAQVAKLAQERAAPVEFILLGSCHVPLPASIVRWGSYADAQVQELIAQIDPHLVWLPAQCPETWSYTLSAAFKSGLPVLTSAIGVFPERLQGRPLSWQCAHRAAVEQWLRALLDIRGLHFKPADVEFWSWLPPPAFYLNLPVCGEGQSNAGLEHAYWRAANLISQPVELPAAVVQSLAVAVQRARRGGGKWRSVVLGLLSWLRGSGCLAPLVRWIPYRWQQRIKRMITREPLAERSKARERN